MDSWWGCPGGRAGGFPRVSSWCSVDRAAGMPCFDRRIRGRRGSFQSNDRRSGFPESGLPRVRCQLIWSKRMERTEHWSIGRNRANPNTQALQQLLQLRISVTVGGENFAYALTLRCVLRGKGGAGDHFGTRGGAEVGRGGGHVELDGGGGRGGDGRRWGPRAGRERV